jgi:hypothetical protein
MLSTTHSYEEIRAAFLDLLAGREKAEYYTLDQYGHVSKNIAIVLQSRELPADEIRKQRERNEYPYLCRPDDRLLSEVFWNLFLERIITLGAEGGEPIFPWFRLSQYGREILKNPDTHFYHDVASFELLIRREVRKIHETTVVYLKESMQAFRAGCLLSSTVMLGVAAEDTFLRLAEAIKAGGKHPTLSTTIENQRQLLPKVMAYLRVLDSHKGDMTSDLREGLDSTVLGIQELIRTYRNESGHPSGKIIAREQCYVLLNLFVPYARKMYQLIDHYA